MTSPSLREVEQLLAEEPFLRSLARTLLRDEADEVVQQTWLRALSHASAPVHEPRNWLARIARNVAHNLRRGSGRRRLHEQQAARAEIVPSSADLLEREERRRSLVFAVDRLPSDLRTVVLLRYFDNLQPQEIAERLSVTVAAVSNRLLRALALLRQRLDAQHGERRAWLMPLIPFAAGRPAAACAFGATSVGVLLMTTKSKALCAALALLLAGFAVWAVATPWSEEPAAGPGAGPPVTASSDALPADSALPVADAVQRKLATPAMAKAAEATLLVHARYREDHTPVADLLLIVGRAGEDPRVGTRHLRTDAQGNARFEGLAAGRVQVRSALLAGQIERDLHAGEVTEVDYVLRPSIGISGIVVDRSGLPVPGAEVYLGEPGWFGTTDEHATTADAEGRFSLRCCGNPILVGARALGHAASRMQMLVDDKGTRRFDVRIELPGPGGAVEGIVVGPDQSPVADAVVRVGKGNLDYLASTPGVPAPLPAQVRTNRDGRYRAVGIEPGEHPVVVRAPALAPWTGTCQVAADAVTELPVALSAGVTVTGTVRATDGVPAPQTSVTVGSESELTHYRTRSAMDGTFHLDGLPPAEFDLAAVHEHLGKAIMKLRGVAGETLRCDVRLTRGLVLRGRLLTESGELVVHGRVDVTAENRNGEPRWASYKNVDADGRFAIDNCPEDRLLDLEATGQGIAVLRQRRVDPRAGELLLQATKSKPMPPPSARITGTLVLADGKPAANVTIYARAAGGNGVTMTDASGHFELGPVVPGRVRLDVDVDGLPLFRCERDLAACATWDLGTVRLAGGTLLVRFEGKAERVRLLLYDPQGTWVTNVDTTTLPFRSRPVFPGRYQLRVSGPEIAAMTLLVEVRENEEAIADVRPQRGVARQIEFTAAGGWQNIARLEVTIASGSEPLLEKVVWIDQDAPPTFACRLVPGSYTVTAKAEGLSGSTEFAVVEGAGAVAVRVEVR